MTEARGGREAKLGLIGPQEAIMSMQFRSLLTSLLARRCGVAGLAVLSGLLASSVAHAQALAEPAGVVVSGALSEELVRHTILPHLGEVRRCVDFGLAAELQLGGLMLADFRISASGAVSSARIKPSPLQDPQIEQCVLTLLKTWAFPKLRGKVTRVTYPFELFATSDEVSLPAHPELAAVRGSLSKQSIRDTIAPHLKEVKSCYVQGPAAQERRGGKVVVKFLVAASGAVAGSILQSSTLNDLSTERCITSAVKGWKFARPQGGSALLAYPFVLRADGGVDATESD